MSTIAVDIRANVTDLQTKMALARAEMRAFNADTKSLADQVRVAGDAEKAALLPQLEASVGKAAAAQSAFSGLKGELDALSGGGGHGSISTATREFRALFDELSSGRTRYTPGTLAIIANRVFGLQASTLLAAGGVAALVGGLAYLAVKAAEASQALDKIQASAAFAGNAALTREQIQGLVTDVQHFADVSSADARKIVGAFAGMKDETTPLLKALSAEVGDYMQATGEDATKATEALTRAFADPLAEGKKFLETIPQVTQAQLDAFDAAKRMGDANEAAAVMVQALDTALDRARGRIDAQRQSAIQDSIAFSLLAGDTGDATGALSLQNQVLADNNKARQRQVELLREATSALKTTPASPDMTLQLGVKAAEQEDTTGTRIAKIRGDIQQMQAALAVARSTGSQLNVDRLTAGLAAANRELSQLTSGGDHLAQFRETLAEMQSSWTGTHTAMLQRSVAMWQQELAAADLSAKERLEVEKGYAEAKTALARAQQQEQDQIRRADLEGDLEISRLQIDARKSALEQDLQAHKITSQQKLDELKQLTQQEDQLNLQALEQELAMLKQQPAEYERVYNQIRVLKAKEVADLAALDRQAQIDAQKEARAETQIHKDMAREIMSAEDSLVRGIFSGRQSLTQSLETMASQLVQRELANDLKYLTMKLLFGREEEAAERSTATGGMLVHLFAESQKTAATVAGTAARTATVTAGAAAQGAAESAATKGSVLKHAASAAAAVYDDVAQIPYVGWILAPPAAAVAFAAVAAFGDMIPSFDVGSSMIGASGLAMVHQGEAIVPARSAQDWRDGGGGSPVIVNLNVSAVDGQSVANLFKNNSSTLTAVIANAVRNGNGNLNTALKPA
jgi:hypothetical protein